MIIEFLRYFISRFTVGLKRLVDKETYKSLKYVLELGIIGLSVLALVLFINTWNTLFIITYSLSIFVWVTILGLDDD